MWLTLEVFVTDCKGRMPQADRCSGHHSSGRCGSSAHCHSRWHRHGTVNPIRGKASMSETNNVERPREDFSNDDHKKQAICFFYPPPWMRSWLPRILKNVRQFQHKRKAETLLSAITNGVLIEKWSYSIQSFLKA
jgi:hypothetical protein